MILLRLISWQYARKHLLRSLLTTTGIVLGVAVFVGMHTSNRSVQQAFADTVDRIAGRTQLQISAGETGFEEEVLERVQAVAEVRAAAPVVESVVRTNLAGQGNLLVLGVDMTGDRSLRDYDFESGDEDVIDDPLVFLAQPDSIILTCDFAARNGLASGSRLRLESMEGPKEFTVRGILRAGGMTSAFGGNLAIMDIYAAQKMFGRGRRFDRIDVGLKDGVTLEQGEAAIARALGPAFEIEPPSRRGAHFASLMAAYTLGVNISSAFALFIGVFIIYNAFSIAVTERRAEIGILRALGATRGQIRALFLGESAVAGLIGSVAGVGFGLLVSRTLTGDTSRLAQDVFGVMQPPQEVQVEPWLLTAAVLLGVAASMLAALIPARNAARVDPVQALQKGKYQVLSAGESRLRAAAGALTLAFAAVSVLIGRSELLFYAGYLLFLVAAVLFAPWLALGLARLLRRPLKWVRPVEGALAADSLLQAPRRTSATVAALMLSLAMVIGLGGVARASYESIEEWVRTALDPDLFVTASESIAGRGFHFPASMYGELRNLPGVEAVQRVRSARIRYQGKPVLLIGIDMEDVPRRSRWRRVIAGDYKDMHRRAAAGEGFIVSENFAELRRLRLGDRLPLPSPSGMLDLPIVGIVRDYSNQVGTIFLDRGSYIRCWRDDAVDIFRVYARGTPPAELKRRILEKFSGNRRVFVLLNADVREEVMRISREWFGLTYIQMAVAILVAILGIVNTLTVSITDRRRELGVLRAVGALRNQVRHTVWIEALAIGGIALVLGLALGALSLSYQLTMVRRFFVGMPFDYTYPAGIAALLVPVILGAAFGSALLPAESAARGALVEALEYE
ncbi:MAG: FtsX-like permease family protein [Bryobacteraceae bacterium]